MSKRMVDVEKLLYRINLAENNANKLPYELKTMYLELFSALKDGIDSLAVEVPEAKLGAESILWLIEYAEKFGVEAAPKARAELAQLQGALRTLAEEIVNRESRRCYTEKFYRYVAGPTGLSTRFDDADLIINYALAHSSEEPCQ